MAIRVNQFRLSRIYFDEAFGAWQRHTYMSIRRRQCFALVHRRILRASVRIAIGVWRRYASLRASGEAAERARLHAQEVEELQQDAARGRALASRCESLAVDEAALRRRLCVAQSALAEVKQGMMSASQAEAAEERRAANTALDGSHDGGGDVAEWRSRVPRVAGTGSLAERRHSVRLWLNSERRRRASLERATDFGPGSRFEVLRL